MRTNDLNRKISITNWVEYPTPDLSSKIERETLFKRNARIESLSGRSAYSYRAAGIQPPTHRITFRTHDKIIVTRNNWIYEEFNKEFIWYRVLEVSRTSDKKFFTEVIASEYEFEEAQTNLDTVGFAKPDQKDDHPPLSAMPIKKENFRL